MFLFNFDPSYTNLSNLKAIIKVLKIKYIFSLMREEDISEDIINFHKSSYITYWEPSTEQRFNSAFKVIARKIFHIISSPVYDNEGKVKGYRGEANYMIKNRPIYTLITQKEPTSNNPFWSDSNILILRRRSYYFDHIIEPQMPIGGIIGYIKACLKNQDMSEISEYSRFYKSTTGTLSHMEDISMLEIPSSFDKLATENNEIFSNIVNPQLKNKHGFTQEPKLEYNLRFLIQENATPPELLVLDEITLSDFISKYEKENRFTLYSDIKRLQNFLFNHYLAHLLSRELNIPFNNFIKSYLTPPGREKYNLEEEEYEEECRREEEYEEECARYQAEKAEWQDYEKELKDELNDIRNNGGDWIDD